MPAPEKSSALLYIFYPPFCANLSPFESLWSAFLIVVPTTHVDDNASSKVSRNADMFVVDFFDVKIKGELKRI